MSSSLLLALLAATPLQPWTSEPEVACLQSCERHVPPEEVDRVCARCVGATEVAAWTASYRKAMPEAVARSALQDPLWEVRWGVLAARARAQAVSPATALAAYLRAQAPMHRAEGCVVAAGAAALQEGEVLRTARRLCAAHREEVREAIEPQLYAPREAAQEEALRQLILLLEEGAGSVVLQALRGRPVSLDEVPAALLLRVSARDLPVGKILLQDASESTAPEVNRLLAVYALKLDALRPGLKHPTPEERWEVIRQLARLLPLSAPELEGCLDDPEVSVRHSAGWALAEANGRSLAEEILTRVPEWEQKKVPELRQARWVELMGHGQRRGCDRVLERVALNRRLSPEVRGVALGAMGACGAGAPLTLLRREAASPEEAVRAGVIRALADLPSSGETARMAVEALEDPSPRVLAEALRAIDSQGTQAVKYAPDYLAHPSSAVRLAAAKMLARGARAAHVGVIKERLKEEPEGAVRAELTRALGTVGGPVAAATLAELKSQDPDAYVRQVAISALKQLGFSR